MGKISLLSDYRHIKAVAKGPKFQPALLLYYPDLSVVEICVSDSGLQDIEEGLASGIVDPLVSIHSQGDYQYAIANASSIKSFVELANILKNVVVPNPYYLSSPSGSPMAWNRVGFIPPEGDSAYVSSVDFNPLGDTWVFGPPTHLASALQTLDPNDFVSVNSVGRLEGEIACFSISSRSVPAMKYALNRNGIILFSHSRSVNISPPKGSFA